jgi:hypothetical protein
MPGTCLFISEPDLSHFQAVDGYHFSVADTFLEQNNQSISPVKSYLLPLAFLVSLAIHGGFLFIQLSTKPPILESPNIRIHIELAPTIKQSPIADSIETFQKVPVETPEQVPVETPEQVPIETPEQVPIEKPVLEKPAQTEKFITKVIESVPASPTVVLSLTPEELNAITGSVHDETEPTDAHLTEVSSEPFGSVFDPRLRARLQAQVPASQGKDVGTPVVQWANGSMQVELGDRHCLMTLPEFRHEDATNWYHTTCKNKTESERMMDRVNESMRARYKKTP